MSAEKVFRRMLDHHIVTGEVMQDGTFIKEIVLRFETAAIIDGLLRFNQYLDERRQGA